MIMGITGTRTMPTASQEHMLAKLIKDTRGLTELHHGCCLGADAMSHHYALRYGVPVVIHPPTNARAMAVLRDERDRLVARTYKQRNQAIVDACDWLVALPKHPEWDERSSASGTWQTIRMARKQGRHITIIYGNGGYTEENLLVT